MQDYLPLTVVVYKSIFKHRIGMYPTYPGVFFAKEGGITMYHLSTCANSFKTKAAIPIKELEDWDSAASKCS